MAKLRGKVRLLDSPAHKKKASEKDVSKELRPKLFPIVGFGASAGGLEAFTIILPE